MFFTTNPPNPEAGNSDAIGALNQFVAGERDAVAVATLSDLDRATAHSAATLWPRIHIDVRRFVVRQMLEQAESNIELNFSRMFFIALDDPDGEIRALAIQGLWENESTALLDRLLRMLEHEDEPAVREAIAEALGNFCLRAFEEVIGPEWIDKIQPALLNLYRSNEPIGVRKKALISVAYLSDSSEVEEAIRDAFGSTFHDLRSAAIFAMGVNLNPSWFNTLLGEATDEDPEIRFEATRAIGRLGDERAVSLVLDLLDDEDREVQLAAIGALGEIGGKTAVATLRRLVKSDDVVVSDAASEALHDATIGSSPVRFDV